MPNDMRSVQASPIFDPTTFLEGQTLAWGIFEDRFGRVRRRFSVEMSGRWEGSVFYLEETFLYDDGTTEKRVWRIVPEAKGRFTATCADCVGTARGECDANTIRMSYRFRLRLENRTIDVDFDDRIYLVSDAIAVNRAVMRKWGVRLGAVSLFFHRGDDGQDIRQAAAAA